MSARPWWLAIPALRNLAAILPADLQRRLEGLPWQRRANAVGFHLTYWESRIILGAIGHMTVVGVVGLPMHDAIIVRRSDVGVAVRGLEGAFGTMLKVRPLLKVEPA